MCVYIYIYIKEYTYPTFSENSQTVISQPMVVYIQEHFDRGWLKNNNNCIAKFHYLLISIITLITFFFKYWPQYSIYQCF